MPARLTADNLRSKIDSVNIRILLTLASASSLVFPLAGQQEVAAATPAAAPFAAELARSINSLEMVVLPTLRSARDEESADAAAAELEQVAPQIRQLALVLAGDLTPEEERQVLPLLAPRMKRLLSQLDNCCRLSAEILSRKPAAYGSERFAAALTDVLDTFMGVPAGAPSGRTNPADIPLALAEADAQLAAAVSLLASLERLQSREAVDRELPTISQQLNDLRALHRDLSDPQRWSKTQLFLIMQRTRTRGTAIITDLGKCTARLMGLNPPCYGSAELESILSGLLGHTQQPQVVDDVPEDAVIAE